MATIKGTNGDDGLYGTNSADVILGLNGNDVLKGGGGADQIDGGAGIDTMYYTDSTVGVGVNLGAGRGLYGTAEGDTLVSIERVYGSFYDDNLIGGAYADELFGLGGKDLLKGGGGADKLDGGTGDDTLKGGGGADRLDGGDGIDTADYTVAETAVTADLKGGSSAGEASGDTFYNIENLTGSSYDDWLSGNDGGNVLSGGDGADMLDGAGGADTLYGGKGDDRLTGDADLANTAVNTLVGGLGNDHYTVRNTGDVIVEYAGEGLDSVTSLVTYRLPDNVENLGLSGQGPMNATGNALDNRLLGNEDFNILDGKGGADYMNGNSGDDWYFVDNAGDYARETANFGHFDRVFASVDYALFTGSEIERLSTNNHVGIAPINLSGNELNNEVFGNAGSNALKGMLGNDTLIGLGGIDAFVFNTALGPNNVDYIADFSVADDDIILGSWIFDALPAGTLSASAFRVGAAAADADDRIIYNSATGAISYDADGTAPTSAVHFATVNAGLALTNADFIIV